MSLWETDQRDDGVVVAAYRNDPMNYLTGQAAEELGGLMAEWQDPGVRAVVLCGAVPGRFITHYSVEELLALAEDREALPEVWPAMSAGFQALLAGPSALPKPVIVAMTGDTMGGGLELSLACDIRVAEAGPYRIGFLETKLGIIPGGGGTQRLARMLGAAAAVEIVMRGRVFTPEQACARGIVHEVAADARTRAVEIASELAALSPVAVAQAKRAVYDGVELPLAAGLAIEADAFLATMVSDEGVAAMRSYVETPLDERRAFAEPG
jgi:enoyl-CoA hydratase/carnithine racemase